jgi:hypothetical protein
VAAEKRTGVSLELSLSAADVGQRVMVRRRLPDGQLTDVLGELLAWADEVVVRDRHGASHAFPAAAVVAGKRIPPPPARR